VYNYGLGKCFTPFHCNGAVKKRCSVGPRKKTFVTTVAVREQPDTSRCNPNTVRRNGNSIFVDKECNGVFTVCFANGSYLQNIQILNIDITGV
jgi:ribosomal protein L37AE/L43A